MKIKRGSTSVRRLIFIADSSSTTGAGLTSLVYNSAGLSAYYFAGDLSNEVQITLATATLGTYTSGGFVAVDNTNMPGWYEIGIPDAALDGGNEVCIQLRGANNMVPVNIYIELDAFDYQTATIAPDNASIAAIKLQTDNLPSDPADQSLIVAATDAIISRLGSPAGASVSADIAAVKTDTGNLVTRITSTLFAGITSLGDWIRRISRKDAGTAGMIAAEAEIDTGGTSTFSGLTDSLEAIADASGGGGGDASQTTLLAVKARTDLIGTAQANVALTAAAVLDIGTITGFPTELIIGDSYDSDSGEIEVTILDSEGDPITAIGSLQLEDADIEFTAYRTGDPSSLHISGSCSYSASVVSISLASSATSIGKPEFTYEGRLKFIWTAEDAQKTFKTPQFKFIENP